MIKSFKDAAAERLWRGRRVRQFEAITRQARRRLDILNAATSLQDLALNPGNRLHALMGDRQGQHSISINMQYRVCFVWKDGDAYDVEISDYH